MVTSAEGLNDFVLIEIGEFLLALDVHFDFFLIINLNYNDPFKNCKIFYHLLLKYVPHSVKSFLLSKIP
jgi:hypothetical protein